MVGDLLLLTIDNQMILNPLIYLNVVWSENNNGNINENYYLHRWVLHHHLISKQNDRVITFGLSSPQFYLISWFLWNNAIFYFFQKIKFNCVNHQEPVSLELDISI